MIDIAEALRLVETNLPARNAEVLGFRAALGRVLAGDIAASEDLPPFHRSAMDGFALRAEDAGRAPVRLVLAGEIRAGGGATVALRPGHAVAIMTGAPVPEGADAVQMVEHTRRSADGREVVILRPVQTGENISPRGSEAREGEVVLEKGRVLGPAELAVLAAFGRSEVSVYRRPRVALLSTGDELVEVEDTPAPDQIRNSNAYSLTAQLRLMGLEPDYLGIARDDREDLRRGIGLGLERDILILTGGVSMGEYDLVPEVFSELGLQVLFARVAIKPGKPTVFARKGDRLVFGLPGNPVSTFVAFENFVRPALGWLCGLDHPELPRVRGALLREMKQKPGRTAFLPAWIEWTGGSYTVDPLPWTGSADIIGFSRANGTLIFPGDRDRLEAGDTVEAMLLPDHALRRRMPEIQPRNHERAR